VAADVERVESPFRQSASSKAEPRRRRLETELPLRPMSGYEEEAVEERLGAPNTAALCNEILARCLVAAGADFAQALRRVRGLLVAERDIALISLRRRSLGDQVEMEADCPACGASNDACFTLDTLPLPDGDVPEHIHVTLADGTEVELRLPTAGDQEMLLDAGIDTDSRRRTWLLAHCITRLGNREGSLDADTVRALAVADRRALEQALEAALPTLDLGMALACCQCEHRFSTPFDVSSFFLPS
jgi:hypothetical protein